MGAPEPRADLPSMPGYGGYVDRITKRLPWIWAIERLTESHDYLVITVRPDGRPHAMPVWGLWLDKTLLFSTGASSQKAKNLARNASCTICTDRLEESVVVEGTVSLGIDAGLLQRFKNAYKEKYDWDMGETSADEIYVLHPRVAFGMLEKQSDEVGGVTRWTFGE